MKKQFDGFFKNITSKFSPAPLFGDISRTLPYLLGSAHSVGEGGEGGRGWSL